MHAHIIAQASVCVDIVGACTPARTLNNVLGRCPADGTDAVPGGFHSCGRRVADNDEAEVAQLNMAVVVDQDI
jgi:hypothetical protein